MSAEELRSNRGPVRRLNAERYLFITLVSFGGSVFLTRLFLALTNYPQLGNSVLHFAHVLWGGLFLFIASLLPIIFGNEWAFDASAIAGGIGFGLFIDEVGKFITRTNDYFYPPAAPIIYTSFLILVWVYIHFRKSKKYSSREEMYQTLSELKEVLDRDLEENEKQAILKRTEFTVATSGSPIEIGLAKAVDAYMRSDKVHTVIRQESWFRRRKKSFKERLDRIANRFPFRLVLIASLGVAGFIAVSQLAVLIGYSLGWLKFGEDTSQLPFITEDSNVQLFWLIVRIIAQGLVGFLSFLSALLLFVRKEDLAVRIAIVGLTVSLTVVNILIFYIDQFSAIFGTVFEFSLLLLTIEYKRRLDSAKIKAE